MRRAAKVDANQAEIIRALRIHEASVEPRLAAVGQGAPDLLVGYKGKTFILELKLPGQRDKLTLDEAKWHREWAGQVAVVTTWQEACYAIGALPPSPEWAKLQRESAPEVRWVVGD